MIFVSHKDILVLKTMNEWMSKQKRKNDFAYSQVWKENCSLVSAFLEGIQQFYDALLEIERRAEKAGVHVVYSNPTTSGCRKTVGSKTFALWRNDKACFPSSLLQCSWIGSISASDEKKEMKCPTKKISTVFNINLAESVLWRWNIEQGSMHLEAHENKWLQYWCEALPTLFWALLPKNLKFKYSLNVTKGLQRFFLDIAVTAVRATPQTNLKHEKGENPLKRHLIVTLKRIWEKMEAVICKNMFLVTFRWNMRPFWTSKPNCTESLSSSQLNKPNFIPKNLYKGDT